MSGLKSANYKISCLHNRLVLCHNSYCKHPGKEMCFGLQILHVYIIVEICDIQIFISQYNNLFVSQYNIHHDICLQSETTVDLLS